MTDQSVFLKTHFHIGSKDRIVIDGVEYKFVAKGHHSYVLQNGNGLCETFDCGLLGKLSAAGKIEHTPEYWSAIKAERRATGDVLGFHELSPSQRESIGVRQAFVETIELLMRERNLKFTDVSMLENLHAIERRASEFYQELELEEKELFEKAEEKANRKRAKNGGTAQTVLTMPHPRTLRRWYKRYEKHGLICLSDENWKKGNRSSYFSPEENLLMNNTIRESYLSEQRRTKAGTYQDMKMAFSDANVLREKGGETRLKVPSREAVRSRINQLDAFEVILCREGLAAAQKRFTPVKDGIDVHRPLERVEMDEWKIDLITILKACGTFSLFTEEELETLGLDGKTGRWWVSAAIDCRTKCILGFNLVHDPNHFSSIKTLDMVMTDKGPWADAVGALSGWPGCGKPETVGTDLGSAYRSEEFTSACADLGITHLLTIGGLPMMRGTIERFFKTTAMNLLQRLNGRTFSSILNKGAHKPEERACLGIQDLCFALTRWLVDVYHNTPHSDLGGRTPLEQWEADMAAGNYALCAAPSTREKRLAYGLRQSRVVSKSGVTVLGVHYNCEGLAQEFMRKGKHEVQLRWLADDIGSVSVGVGGNWIEVPAVNECFKGLHAQEWVLARRNLAARDPKQELWRDEIVARALKEITAMNSTKSLEFGLVTQEWSSERIKGLEDNLLSGIRIIEAEAHSDVLHQTDYGQEIVPMAETQPSTTSDALVQPKRIAKIKFPTEEEK
ncbi:transposase family protein [Parasedimentitalea maritima]|uniref:Transposase family protein n=1 Tax=Parasedimentitalea maritima TaxID=2578117 RepID=A0ABY2UR69_9RHOB|nr:DDE-type integrase/transposase/recombinase [Zongyanglinia marina]TLP58515.1 transposase family protein [Zongyanglinia marina]